MTPDELNAYWTRVFPECPPVGFLLKHVYRDRVARFAGAEDPAEACSRQNVLLDHVFCSEPRVVLITTVPSEAEAPPDLLPSFVNVDPEGRFFQSLGMHEFELEFDTPSYWHLFMREQELLPGAFDAPIRAAARGDAAEGVVNVLVLGPSTRRLFYTHAEGADIVMESGQKRDQLVDRYRDWAVSASAQTKNGL